MGPVSEDGREEVWVSSRVKQEALSSLGELFKS